MEGRGFVGSLNYRYGYQGSEKDNEVNSSNGTSYTTEFRQLDTRLGRWFSSDPVFQPWQSSYTSMDNNPINYTDVRGLSKDNGDGTATVDTKGESAWSVWSKHGKGKISWSKFLELNKVDEKTGKADGKTVKVGTTFKIKEAEEQSKDEKEANHPDYSENYFDKMKKGISERKPTREEKKAIETTDPSGQGADSFEKGEYSVRSPSLRLLPKQLWGGNSLFDEFKYGTGPVNSVFLDDHYATKALQKSEAIKELRNELDKKFGGDIEKMKNYAKNNAGFLYTGFVPYGGTFLPWDENGDVFQFIGTFSADVRLSADGTFLIFFISDSKSEQSLTPGARLLGVDPNKERRYNGQRKSNTYQKYIFKERIKN
jgi:RHS repeat-associated protein